VSALGERSVRVASSSGYFEDLARLCPTDHPPLAEDVDGDGHLAGGELKGG